MKSKVLGSRSPVLIAFLAASALTGASVASASLTHNWVFVNGTLTDSVAGGPTAGLYNGATITAGTGADLVTGGASDSNTASFISLGGGVLPTSGSVTVEAYFTHSGVGIGYYTNVWNFNNETTSLAGGQTSGSDNPTGTTGQYFMNTASEPARTLASGDVTPGGSAIDFAGAGYNSEQQSTNPSGQAVYLDQNGTYMVAAVLDGTANTLTYYLNGVAQTPVALSSGQTLAAFNDVNSVIGLSAFGGDPSFRNTVFTDFRIYNNALSASSVATDYTNGPAGTPVPEPTTLAVFALGTAGLLLARRRVQA